MDITLLALAIIIAIVLGIAVVQKHRTAALPSNNSAGTSGAAPASPPVRRVLHIEGTEPFSGSAGFVKSFGISPENVQDLRFFRAANASLDLLPVKVRDCLQVAYRQGTSRGTEVPSMVEKGRPLGPDEAVFFALTSTGGDTSTVFAFVDRMR